MQAVMEAWDSPSLLVACKYIDLKRWYMVCGARMAGAGFTCLVLGGATWVDAPQSISNGRITCTLRRHPL